MGFQRKKLQRKQTETFGLNITSMTDMFTILLVFLLQTYSTAEFQPTPDKGVRLPTSNSQTNPVTSIQLSLSKESLKIEEQELTTLTQGSFKPDSLDNNDNQFIKPLFEELRKRAKDIKPEQDGLVLLKADESISYDTIRKVMYTVSMAGYPKLKLATVVGN